MQATGQSGIWRFLPLLAWILAGMGLLALVLLAVGGPGYRMDWWELGTGFTLLRWGAWLGVAVIVLGVIAGGLLLWRGEHRALMPAVAGLVCAAIAVSIPMYWQARADSVPPIHDISTDLDDPPEFVAVAPLREDAPNPVEYAGEETAEAQREAYPHIETLRVSADMATTTDAAVRLASRRGWDLVEADPGEGRIEATATTRWFGFKDDVVIRIRTEDDQTLVDMRSKSRFGRSDVGTNAARIDAFLADLKAELGEPEGE